MTNFYAVTPGCENDCGHCSQSKDWHICKNLTIFRGYRDDVSAPSPWGRIASWQDWRAILRGELGPAPSIVDEYMNQWDAEEFITRVEQTPSADRRRQYDQISRGRHGYRDPNRDWLDPDGFSFTGDEFW